MEIKLAPVQAPYFAGAHVLIAADCTAFAYADFHRGFMRGRITLIGCPKLDGVDYSQKLEALFASNDIASGHRGAHGGAVLRRPGTMRRAPRSSAAARTCRSRWR